MAENMNTKDDSGQLLVQSMECPVCLSIFNDPKSLSCSHSYCQACLERLLKGQADQQKISCPVCKEVTKIPDGGVAQLEGNEALKTQIGSAVNQRLVCTVCTSQDGQQPGADNYCLDCDHYMCLKCFQRHLDWELFAAHVIIPVQDIISGQTILRSRPKCKKHPTESEECFCIKCRKYTCFRCGVKEHAQKNHRLVEATEHEAFQKKNIKQLQSRADAHKSTLRDHLVTIKEQQQRLGDLLQIINDDIDRAYQEAVQQLTAKKEALRGEAKERIEELVSTVRQVEEACQQQIDRVEAASALAGNGLKMPLEKEAMNAHDKLAENLKRVLEEGTQDLEDRISEKKIVNLSFEKNISCEGLDIGHLVEVKSKWTLKIDVAISREDGINGLAPRTDGRMAVGCNPGGLHLFSTDGQCNTELSSLKISKVDFLSDGRCVIRDPKNDISLYTADYKKVDVKFFTPHWSEGGYGGLAVDRDDLIHVSQSKQEIIQVFRPTGGNSIREIFCSGEKPWQMCSMSSRKMIIIQRTDRYSVGVIDETGALRYSIKSDVPEVHACPALYHDDNVLIAWVRFKVGLVSIIQYSHQLEQVRTLVNDYQIKIPSKHSYFLEVFKTGEIVFCSKDHLYIFHQT